MKITTTQQIEQLEALAGRVCQDQQNQREGLLRMIRAYCHVLAVRRPRTFAKRPTRYADESDHSDDSYPPEQVYSRRTSTPLYRVQSIDWNFRATTGGFYHQSEYYTESPGYYVDADGDWYAGELAGTGAYGGFAAHPGACDVDCTITYTPTSPGDVPIEVVIEAEQQLRELAAPLMESESE